MLYTNEIRTKQTCGIWLGVLICLFVLIACGGGSDNHENSTENTSPKAGSVAFNVMWDSGQDDSALKQPHSPSGDVCVDYGIDTIACNIYDSSGAIVKSKSWTCSSRSGRITGVSTGSGMWLTLKGVVGSTTPWQGQSGTFTVATDEITPVGSVTVNYVGNDQTPPGLHATSPVDGLNEVSLNTTISVQFTEDVVSASVIPAFTLEDGATAISGIVRYEAASRTATFTPDNDLMESTTYTAAIASTVEDKAGHQMGSDYSWTFTTTALDAPSATTVAATAITQTAARLNASINPNGFATSCYFEYGPNQDYGSTTPTQNLGSGRDPISVYADISGLEPGGTSHYRVVATNAGGTSNGLNRTLTSVAVWAKTFLSAGSVYNYRHLIQQTSDGGYIVASTAEVTDRMQDILLVKLAADGSITWQKTYGRELDDRPLALLQVADGSYVILVHSDREDGDVLMLRVDESGVIITADWYDGPHTITPTHIQQTMDGGYIISGSAINPGEYEDNLWAMKLNPNGITEWGKVYGSFEVVREGAHIQQTLDGGYVFVGTVYHYYTTSASGWVLKLDPEGGVIWQRSYGGIGIDQLYAVQQTADGGYVLAGATESHGAGGKDVWVLKLAANGDVTWQKSYGGTRLDRGASVRQTSDGGYIVAGDTYSFSQSGSDADTLVLKLTEDGDVDWQKVYGGDQNEDGGAILQTHDGGFIMTANTDSYGNPPTPSWGNLWVLKMDQTGAIGCAMGRDTTVSIFTPSGASTITTASESTAYVDRWYIPFYEANVTASVETQCP